MTGFDIAVLLLVGLGAITGFMRGFVQEILALLAWIFSLFAIHYLHTPMTDFLQPRIGTPSGAAVLAFAILLLIPYAATKVLANWLGAASRSSVLGPIDRVPRPALPALASPSSTIFRPFPAPNRSFHSPIITVRERGLSDSFIYICYIFHRDAVRLIHSPSKAKRPI
ncbi:MAG: CvpA family protein [Sphingomonadales bacterium]|nr:CvpA family protein [Sphingomonadales bacterium]